MIPKTTIEWIAIIIIPAPLLDFFLMRAWRKYHDDHGIDSSRFILWELILILLRAIRSFFTRPEPVTLETGLIPWNFFTLRYKLPILDHNDYPDSEPSAPPNIVSPKRKILKSVWKAFLLLAFLGCAIYGQYNFLQYPEGENKGLLYYGIAILCFILLIFQIQGKPYRKPSVPALPAEPLPSFWSEFFLTGTPKHRKQVILSSAAVFLALVGLVLLIIRPLQAQHWDIFFIWACSWILYLVVFVKLPPMNVRLWWQKYHVDIITIAILTILGGFFRFYKIGLLPNIIDGDEGRFGLIILDILKGKLNNMFITTYGNSSMYFFFLAGMMKIFGVGTPILRIGSAIGGTLTIPFLYMLTKQIANRRTALISTTVLVAANFHLHFSRIMSVTGVQDAFFATVSLYFFYSGLKNKSRTRLIISGLTLGLALYVYMGARLILMLIPIYLLILFLLNRTVVRENQNHLIHFLITFTLVALPMIYWAVSNPGAFNIRANQVGVFQSGWLATESRRLNEPQWLMFLQLIQQAFLTTIFYPSYGFHYSTWPMLDALCSIFFIAGLTYSLLHTHDMRYLLLNGWFWSGILVGGAMVILPSFNAYRMLIIFPVLCIFCGIGLDRILSLNGNTNRFLIRIQSTLIAIFLIIVSVINLQNYFFNYIAFCRYEHPDTRLASLIGSYTGKLDKNVIPYLLTYPTLQVGTHLSMNFLDPGHSYQQFLDPLTAAPDNLDQSKNYVFYIILDRENELEWIEQALPGGSIDTINECNQVKVKVYTWTHE